MAGRPNQCRIALPFNTDKPDDGAIEYRPAGQSSRRLVAHEPPVRVRATVAFAVCNAWESMTTGTADLTAARPPGSSHAKASLQYWRHLATSATESEPWGTGYSSSMSA